MANDNSLFEVTQDEYIGFVEQINSEMVEHTTNIKHTCTWTEVYSIKTKKELCATCLKDNGTTAYYVYNMPDDDERIAPKPHLKVELTEEETHQFFQLLSEAMKEKNNARTV